MDPRRRRGTPAGPDQRPEAHADRAGGVGTKGLSDGHPATESGMTRPLVGVKRWAFFAPLTAGVERCRDLERPAAIRKTAGDG